MSAKYNVAEGEYYGIKYHSKEKMNVASISVRNVQHPQIYGQWNTNFNIRPGIHYDRINFSPKYLPAEATAYEYPDVRFERLSFVVGPRLTTHTPIGQFALTYGVGVGFTKTTDLVSLSERSTDFVQKIDLAYVAFLTKRIFILTGPRFYRDKHKHFVFAFRLGFYWGRVSRE